jgi:hypothetical protein
VLDIKSGHLFVDLLDTVLTKHDQKTINKKSKEKLKTKMLNSCKHILQLG